MSWLLTSPSHQPPWYSLCEKGSFFSIFSTNIITVHPSFWTLFKILFLSNLAYHEVHTPSLTLSVYMSIYRSVSHDDVIQWKHFLRYWLFVWGIHRWPVNSPHKDQWHGALMFSLICVWINGWVNNREAGDFRRHRPLWRHRYVSSSDSLFTPPPPPNPPPPPPHLTPPHPTPQAPSLALFLSVFYGACVHKNYIRYAYIYVYNQFGYRQQETNSVNLHMGFFWVPYRYTHKYQKAIFFLFHTKSTMVADWMAT